MSLREARHTAVRALQRVGVTERLNQTNIHYVYVYVYITYIYIMHVYILPKKVRVVKAMVFPVVMYGCERRMSTKELMLLNCGVGEYS